MPKMRLRVVCGLSDTIATFPPQSAFTSVDLPTFGRPATATKPLLIGPRANTSAPARRGERAGLDSWRFAESEPTPPDQRWGCRPTTHYGERSESGRARLCKFCRDSSRVEVPRVRQEVRGRV